MKELVDELNQRAPLLEITRDDINNKVRIIKGQREEEERRGHGKGRLGEEVRHKVIHRNEARKVEEENEVARDNFERKSD